MWENFPLATHKNSENKRFTIKLLKTRKLSVLIELIYSISASPSRYLPTCHFLTARRSSWYSSLALCYDGWEWDTIPTTRRKKKLQRRKYFSSSRHQRLPLKYFLLFFLSFLRAQNRTFIKVVIDFLFRFSSPTDNEKMHTLRAVCSLSCILRRLYTKFKLWAHNLLLQTRLARDVYPNLIKSFILQLGTPYKFALSRHHLGYFFRCKWASWEKFCFQSCTILYFFYLYLLSNLSAHSLYTIVGKLRFLIRATLLCIIYSLSLFAAPQAEKNCEFDLFFCKIVWWL